MEDLEVSGKGKQLTSHKLSIRWITEKASLLNVTTKCCSQIHECNERYPSPKRVKKFSFHFRFQCLDPVKTLLKYWLLNQSTTNALYGFCISVHLERKMNVFVCFKIIFCYYRMRINWLHTAYNVRCAYCTLQTRSKWKWWPNAECRLVSPEPLNAHAHQLFRMVSNPIEWKNKIDLIKNVYFVLNHYQKFAYNKLSVINGNNHWWTFTIDSQWHKNINNNTKLPLAHFNSSDDKLAFIFIGY